MTKNLKHQLQNLMAANKEIFGTKRKSQDLPLHYLNLYYFAKVAVNCTLNWFSETSQKLLLNSTM